MLYKYPRTYHLPWSLGSTSDDKVLSDTSHFEGKMVVVTEKMDGENTTMLWNYYHARSISSSDHPSRHYVKKMWAEIRKDIPKTYRICGENLYAKHSIFYNNLESYFQVFNIWDGITCLSYNETVEWCELLGLVHVRVLYHGIYDEELIKQLDVSDIEGYVVRKVGSFNYFDFNLSVAKYVRKDHVQTDEHWMNQEIVPNKLKEF